VEQVEEGMVEPLHVLPLHVAGVFALEANPHQVVLDHLFLLYLLPLQLLIMDVAESEDDEL